MSNQRLPPIVLTCRNGHEVQTRARGGQAIKCPECRVAVWVPADRKTNEADSGSGDDAFTGRWDSEPEFTDEDALTKSGHQCQTCGTEQYWEPGRTMLICPQCRTSSLPPTIQKRYAEIEVRKTAPDPVAQIEKRQAEMRLRMKISEQRDRLIRVAEGWAEFVDPDRLENRSPLLDVCIGLESNLRHVIAELRKTTEPEELIAAKTLLSDLISKAKEHEYQIRSEHDRTEAEDDEDEDQYDEDDEDEYVEAEIVEDDNPAQLSSYQRHLLASRGQAWDQRRPALPAIRPTAPPTGMEILSKLAMQQAVKRATQTNCQFDHFFTRKATRKMWGASWPGEQLYQGRPVVYTCEAHNDAGIKWLESQGYENSTFEMLEGTT